jgi:hypothetical protein
MVGKLAEAGRGGADGQPLTRIINAVNGVRVVYDITSKPLRARFNVRENTVTRFLGLTVLFCVSTL